MLTVSNISDGMSMPKEEKPSETEPQAAQEPDSPTKDAPVVKPAEPAEPPQPVAGSEPAVTTAATPAKKKFSVKDFLHTKKGKVVAVLVAVVLVVTIVFAVPVSRYAVAGLVIKKDLTIEVVDSETGKPVSAAQVRLAQQTAKTDANGKATFKSVPVGNWTVNAEKNHHNAAKIDALVPILTNPGIAKISMVATGRQVPVSVTNKLSGKAIGGVEITAGDATATTADNGEATLVLPADQPTVAASFKAGSYNDLAANITVTEQPDDKNKFAMTPAGKVYFLSKRTGKIDVMSSNLDGSGQTVVLAGTGKEDPDRTILKASPDWKYLVLMAKRETAEKLYLITTADNKLSVIDEGANITFTPEAWSGDTFVYKVFRGEVKMWEPKRFSLKSFNAASKKVTTLDDSEGTGSSPSAWLNQIYGDTSVIDGRMIYVKYWEDHLMTGELNPKKDQIVSVKVDGSDKKVLKDFNSPWTNIISVQPNKVKELYFRVSYHTMATEYFVYKDGTVAPTQSVNDNSYYQLSTPQYRLSPDNTQTLWGEMRDVFTIFVGNADGGDGKELVKGDYIAQGWVGSYVLLSKESQMFIMPADPSTGAKPLPVTEFYRSGMAGYFGW